MLQIGLAPSLCFKRQIALCLCQNILTENIWKQKTTGVIKISTNLKAGPV